MVQEPSHVKQLSPIHVCKIGLKGKESLVSMCGRLRKVSPSSSHLGGVEGEGVPGEHVWQVEEGLHSL